MSFYGLKVYDFHPIHLYLNSVNGRTYQLLRADVPKLSQATKEEVRAYMQNGTGTQTFFIELVEHLATTGPSMAVHSLTIRP